MMQVKNKIKIIPLFILALCFYSQGAFALEEKSWKVLVYMQADNNLAPYALWDLAEMEQGLKSIKNVQVFTELDLPGKNGSYRLEILENLRKKPDELSYYETHDLSSFSTQLISIQDELMPQKEKLLGFLQWAQKTHPTDYTLLVLWGHGEGWGSSLLAQFGGIALDDYPVSRLSIADVEDILTQMPENSINFLSMDACLMQTAEVALQFSRTVEYVSGSTQIQSFRGLPYKALIQKLSISNPYEFAQSLSALYEQALKKYATQEDKKNATMSVVNTKEMELIFTYSFNKALEKLIALLKAKPFLKMLLSSKLQHLPSFLGHSRDLSTFIGEIQKFLIEQHEDEIYVSFDKALIALKGSIVSYAYGEHYLYQQSYYLGYFKALGVWFPSNAQDFLQRRSAFETSAFYQNIPAWEQFLDLLFTSLLW